MSKNSGERPTALYYSVLQYEDSSIALLNKYFDLMILDSPNDDTPDILAQCNVLFAPLGYFLGREKIRYCNKLRVVASNTTGHPHIDVEFLRERDIDVVTLKGQTELLNSVTPTAELTWGLIIALTRNLIPAFESVKNGNWNRRPYGAGRMLSHMTLGVVGYGRLGKMVAGIGTAFGMKVLCFDPYQSMYDENHQRVFSLKELVANSDIVTLHVPHEEETENLVDEEILSCFRVGAFLINTSRGEIIDHQALLEALRSRKLGGAAIDVIEGEFCHGFQVSDHELWAYGRENSNLLISPHIGGSTRDAWKITEEYAIKKAVELVTQKKFTEHETSRH